MPTSSKSIKLYLVGAAAAFLGLVTWENHNRMGPPPGTDDDDSSYSNGLAGSSTQPSTRPGYSSGYYSGSHYYHSAGGYRGGYSSGGSRSGGSSVGSHTSRGGFGSSGHAASS